MRYNGEQTIAAVSTPPGKGGVALIRMSGSDAISIAAHCVRPRNGKPLASLPARYAAYADVFEGEEVLDDVLVTLFRAPHSYTGEDTVEITCHGGMLITRTVLSLLFTHGAQQAGPGEFTRRAVLHGRLSLTDAEAIGCLLDAGSRAQITLSGAASRSHLHKAVSALHDRLLTLISTLYAKIDYPEEDLANLSDAEVLSALQQIRGDMQQLCDTYRTGRAVNEGIGCVLCGAPNVGKSALYNRLAGEDLAIVTDHAGTTRDVLTVSLPLGRVMLRLSDTAGLHETDDPIEQLGVARSRTRIQESELILAVFDGTRVLQEEELALIRTLQASGKCVIALCNKSDLPACPGVKEALQAAFPHVVTLSAATGEGIAALCAMVDTLFTDASITLGEEAIVSSARQHAALQRALAELDGAIAAYQAGYPADIASSGIEGALRELSELDGASVNEEIVAEIFRHFCVGK